MNGKQCTVSVFKMGGQRSVENLL